ncbi:MAG TPA: hypothetical protein DHW39_07460 [Erysipelotrichaceae bacterium]|nr:hypothetical protein [Erysipelotrichaceae bacterium]
MKKKEVLIIAVIALLSLGAILFMKLKPRSTPEVSQDLPAEKAEGDWIAVVHRNKVILWFDSGVDADYTVYGNVGHMHIEVRDRSWHVADVDCYDYTCKNMGWMNIGSYMYIVCLPNDLIIVDGATAMNVLNGE